MIVFLVALSMSGSDIANTQRASLATYQACVLESANSFHQGDLSGDDPVIVAYAAAYSCSTQRAAFVEMTKAFLRDRHPDLGPGSLGKVTAMFIEKQDAELEQKVAAEIGGK